MIQRLLLGLAFLLCMRSQAQAQVFEPGVLVRANGDTLRGEVENGFWVEPPRFIRFRATATSPAQQFQPRQLRAVQFTGGRYFRYEVLPIDHAAEVRLDRLPRGNQPYVHIDSLLAEVLLEAPVTLWRVVQVGGAVHYLLRRPGQPVVELSERRYLRQSPAGDWRVTDGNNYQGQLKLYFGDCPTAREAVAATAYTAAGLVALVQHYNQACDPARQPARSWLPQARPRRREAFQAGVLLGGRFTHFTQSNDSPYTGECLTCNVQPFGGLYAELFQPSRTAALYGELSMSRFQSQGHTYAGPDARGASAYNLLDFRGWLGTARVGVRFFFALPHEQQWLVGIGLEHNEIVGSRITTLSGPPTQLTAQDLGYAEPSLFPNLSLGWRNQRLTLSLDGQLYRSGGDWSGLLFGSNFAVRTGLSYRLGRNPDVAKSTPGARP